MKRLTIFFLILTGLLFLGIALMIKPTSLVQTPEQNQSSFSERQQIDSPVLSTIVVAGSTLTIIGVIGVAILGFYTFRQINQT